MQVSPVDPIGIRLLLKSLKKNLEISWNFVSPKKWEPCYCLDMAALRSNLSRTSLRRSYDYPKNEKYIPSPGYD